MGNATTIFALINRQFKQKKMTRLQTAKRQATHLHALSTSDKRHACASPLEVNPLQYAPPGQSQHRLPSEHFRSRLLPATPKPSFILSTVQSHFKPLFSLDTLGLNNSAESPLVHVFTQHNGATWLQKPQHQATCLQRCQHLSLTRAT